MSGRKLSMNTSLRDARIFDDVSTQFLILNLDKGSYPFVKFTNNLMYLPSFSFQITLTMKAEILLLTMCILGSGTFIFPNVAVIFCKTRIYKR